MLSDQQATLDDYTQRVAAITSFAHAHGAAVEADAGELPSGASGQILEGHSRLTDPAGAARFTAQTGVDLLSVSVGNVHVLLDGRRGLDLERLAQIHHRVDLPLSLHGGTGIASDALREAIHLGVAKVAYGTYLKQRYLAALRQALGSAEIDPHRLLGMGGSDDILVAGRRAVREAVLERIELLGCCGKV
jgi:fructose/tagatose bisphosphate aldolase